MLRKLQYGFVSFFFACYALLGVDSVAVANVDIIAASAVAYADIIAASHTIPSVNFLQAWFKNRRAKWRRDHGKKDKQFTLQGRMG